MADSPANQWTFELLQNVPGLPPITQAVHILGIAVVMASSVMINLRIVGLAVPSQSLTEMVNRLMPWTWGALLVSLPTGFGMFMTRATHYANNPGLSGQVDGTPAGSHQQAPLSSTVDSEHCNLAQIQQRSARSKICGRLFIAAVDRSDSRWTLDRSPQRGLIGTTNRTLRAESSRPAPRTRDPAPNGHSHRLSSLDREAPTRDHQALGAFMRTATSHSSQRLFAAIAASVTGLCLLASAAIGQVATALAPTELEQRLDDFASDLERQRTELNIPGMAIAVVKDDELVMARGFGHADLASQTPATAETIFAIGSSSKAFTAALVGMLVDEGAMAWDDPITKYLPYFDLVVDTEDQGAVVTVRDLLSHRTGFTRMGLLWASNKVSREEILKTATKAKPWAEFRGPFFYNNVTFMAAGVAAEKAGGASWEQLIEQRFFKPMSMNNSTTSVSASQTRPNLSLGYTWKEASKTHDQPPMRHLDSIAPAGSINSSVIDMSQWVRFQLNKGKVGGKPLLSEEQLTETWTKQIEIAEGVDYGLGWMLRQIDGHRVVEHGGNIDGFSAQVTILPEANMGFVLLINLSAAPLQSMASSMFVDAMLGHRSATDSDSEGSEEDLSVFTGKYVANFATFKDSRFTVTEKDGALAIDVPGQMNFELKSPDAEGKRYFALTDQIAVSFDRGANGDVIGLKMYQAGMTFELPREGVEIAAEIPLTELERYIGTYHLKEADKDFKVVIQNQRLALDIPEQTVAELRPPNPDGKWLFRMSDRHSVSFHESEDGAIESMTLHEDGGNQLLDKVQTSEEAALPTVEAVMALRKGTGPVPKAIKFSGSINQLQSGVSGTFTAAASGRNQYVDLDFDRFGWTRVVVTDSEGWSESSFAPTTEFEGKFLRQAQNDNPAGWIGDFRPLFDSVKVLRTEALDGRNTVVLGLDTKDLPRLILYLDAKTGDVLKTEQSTIEPTLGITIQNTLLHSDFRVIDGHRVSHRTSTSNQWSGESIIQLETVEFVDELDPAMFARTQK